VPYTPAATDVGEVYLHNPSNALMLHWLDAVQKVSLGQDNARLLFIGDSTTAGVGAPNPSESFVAQLARRLSMHIPVQTGATISGVPGFDPRLVKGSYSNAFGPGDGALYGTQFSGAPAVFTPGTAVDTIVIWWFKSVGKGTVVINIDGVDQPVIDTGSSDGSFGWKKTTYTVPLASNHVVTIPSPNVNPVHLFVDAYDNSTKSIHVANWGVSGQTSVGFSRASYSLEAISEYKPDLTIIMLGINDAGSGVSVRDWLEFNRQILVAARAGGGDVIFMTPIASSPDAYPINAAGEAAYTKAMPQLATGQGVPWIDIHDLFGPFDQSLFVDGLHPKSQGYMLIAQIVLRALLNL
jgi:lysophospholipase L1-like esterase